MNQKLMNLKDAARFLGCTKKALYRRVERRQIPFRRWGKKLVFDVEELDAFVEGLPSSTVTQTEAIEEAS